MTNHNAQMGNPFNINISHPLLNQPVARGCNIVEIKPVLCVISPTQCPYTNGF